MTDTSAGSKTVRNPQANGHAPEVVKRIEALHRDLGNAITRIYRGESIPALESLRLTGRAFALADACCGFTDFDSVEDVWDALDEAAI